MDGDGQRTGRPRTREPGDRQFVGFQIPVNLRLELEAAAKRHQRSMSAEAVAWLERAFLIDRLVPAGLVSAGLHPMLEVVNEFDRAGADFAQHNPLDGDWVENPDAYFVAVIFAVKKLTEQFPGPWDGERVHGALEQALVMAQHERLSSLGLVRGQGFQEPEEQSAASDEPASPSFPNKDVLSIFEAKAA